ncbi:hypothetical protein LVD15_15230 [Fulvivirga maritima]|uniref:hypothetical protein n=1 Tax=Fulvivirga maritima TaxID=2904247 RepID=UPI001F2823F9|nr:hypothetical protein [Fulvivirga maritima]UII24666.1 hypothetical protein LVD15_15230 [Fulvivirga maritima]
MFRQDDSYWDLSYESYDRQLTSTKIAKAIDEYKKIGALGHLEKEEITKSIELIKEKEIMNLNDVISTFSDVVLSADVELGNLQNPYAELVSGYSEISHGEFSPSHVYDDFDLKKEEITLSFDLNGETYQTKFKANGDWIDPAFFSYLNKVIADNKLSGKFYHIYEDGMGIIYLTLSQFKYLSNNELLVFTD